MSEAAGSSTASFDAGASPAQEEEEQEVIEVATEGGASNPTAVRIKTPAAIYRENHGEYDVPQATIDAIESFKVPDGFQREGAREDSFLYSLGNYYTPVEKSSKNYTAHYKCQVGACRTSKKTIPCKNGARSNVNKHLRDLHHLRGAKGDVRSQSTQNKAGNIKEAAAASKTFSVGEKRCVFVLKKNQEIKERTSLFLL